jgi:gamma-glutamylcyclotransferase (GGCT)/AIG2-like uncharacterized protein YtfP
MKDQSQNGTGKLFAVYGTLRQGFGNHRLLDNEHCEFLGKDITKPELTMISLGGFPGVLPKGSDSIVIEVYRVNSSQVEQQLNWLEGHKGKDHPSNFYNVTEIETKYGTANMYILDNEQYDGRQKVASGDWQKHRLTTRNF